MHLNVWQLLTACGNFWQLVAIFDSFLATFNSLWQLLVTGGNFWQPPKNRGKPKKTTKKHSKTMGKPPNPTTNHGKRPTTSENHWQQPKTTPKLQQKTLKKHQNHPKTTNNCQKLPQAAKKRNVFRTNVFWTKRLLPKCWQSFHWYVCCIVSSSYRSLFPVSLTGFSDSMEKSSNKRGQMFLSRWLSVSPLVRP